MTPSPESLLSDANSNRDSGAALRRHEGSFALLRRETLVQRTCHCGFSRSCKKRNLEENDVLANTASIVPIVNALHLSELEGKVWHCFRVWLISRCLQSKFDFESRSHAVKRLAV